MPLMIQIISGQKGKGKTKYLLEKVNQEVLTANGTIVYLDKNAKHMYELNRNVRLIDVFDYPIHSYEAFLGFLCGIISQDHDIEQVYLDSFLKLAHLSGEEIERAINELDYIGNKYHVTFVLSVSEDNAKLPENAQKATILAL